MREEDLDWKIYHIIVAEENCPVSDIIKMSGVEKEVLLKSLERLEKNCLIKYNKENVQILSLQETIFKRSVLSSTRNETSPVVIENGIIKPNPDYKGNFL